MNAKRLAKILYVEDDADIREVAVLALEAVGGYTVKTCASGAAAVAEAPQFLPDLLVLDVMMPGLDGPATLARLRELPELAGVPAIFMTATVQSKDVDALLALGAIGVVPKPFDPMLLAAQIAGIYERHSS